MKCFAPALASACALAAGAALALLAGCASTQVGAQWSDPSFRGQSLRGARLLVVCEAPDPATQRICQDELAARVQDLGATPVQAPDGAARAPAAEQLLAAARVAGARAVFSASVQPDATIVNPGPTFSFGIGGFNSGGYGSGTSGGVGVTVPTGGQVSTGYAANGMLTDVASGRMMWTAKATTPPQANLNAQLAELAKAVVGAAQQAGLF
ncbi:hypothetical protein [Roseateles violae]|uniref:DUF4136 domain-containing protein n=1 Tax=Roseateles violae TaxID=3058042 RepID=A0ABT8DYI1_9BURK|nr:hypothetical protein [Pelomonas sp. PFR6]MDN3922639.1 hypothetical protein [Pelomonas sp. PFR6]